MKCRCLLCGHEWYSRTDKKPVACARCKRYEWDVPKTSRLSPSGAGNSESATTETHGSNAHGGTHASPAYDQKGGY